MTDIPSSAGGDRAALEGSTDIFAQKTSQNRSDRKAIAVLLLLLVALIAHAFYFNYPTDDAFITFRYVRNMLDGKGLVYNAGDRVEGYTNFLWAMLIAGPVSLGVDMVWTARMLGLLFGMGTLVVVFFTGRYLVPKDFSQSTETWLALLPVALTAGNGAFAMWTVGGLETALFTFLLTLTTFVYLRYSGRAASLGCGFIFALLVMSRPDGIVFLAAALAHAGIFSFLYRREASHGHPMPNAILMVVAFFALYLPYFVWRYSYYGAILPNTFYAKVGTEMASTLPNFVLRGTKYSWLFMADYGLVPIVAAILVFNALIWRPRGVLHIHRKASFEALFLSLQVAACLSFVIYVGGDQLVMHRFFVPILPAVYLLTLRGLCEVFPREADGSKFKISSNRRFLIATACLCGIVLTCLPSLVGREHHRIFNVEKPADADRKLVGTWLERCVGKNTRIALVPAGIIPFYSGLETIDLVGLNDRHIARTEATGLGRGEPGHEKHNSAYVLQRRPDLLFLGACRLMPRKLTAEDLLNYYWLYGVLVPGNREMLMLDEFKTNYSPYAARIGSGYIHFFKRKSFNMPSGEPLTTKSDTATSAIPAA